jgi:hypothetical protein
MNLHPKVKPTLELILEMFRSGNVPKTVTIATFPPFEVPSNTWSLANRIIMALHGTSDARGFNQWKEVGRYVKKGSKAIHILAPWLVNKSPDDTDDMNESGPVHISKILRGFLAVPVFKVENTDGEPLDYEALELPDLPLLNLAASWGLRVSPVAFQNGWYGCYRLDNKEIKLATPEEKTFFHELAHAAHHQVKGKLRNGQDWRQEIVAELSAQVLCHIVGMEPGRTLGNSFDYICHYASSVRMEPVNACLAVLSDIEKVLNLILSESAALKPTVEVPAI